MTLTRPWIGRVASPAKGPSSETYKPGILVNFAVMIKIIRISDGTGEKLIEKKRRINY